ncbi:hypothetical protein PR202_ga27355 [Eleusine coracana subsp. coracana]|uniref:Uncharacterized protein n=1 Tax=Eleusine coracana subsp. coracana TaxID=191504 RepID=A0AAV5DF12_ELECO|nr:hypothetical protein PR202_ga27355 [Eleusine coracana subsp. coracana]
MIATAQAFAQETQGAPSAPDLQKRGVTKGFLSDWWSVFWDSFSSGPGDSESEHPEDDHFIHTFVGHSSLVRSVDFHPKADSSLLCSCDDGGKTGRGKVRFDPTGSCLASVIGNTVNGNGDNKTVHSICWSEHFWCLASVSDDCVRIWPSQGVGHARELSGTKLSYFRSCSFHPKYPNTLVIGGYQKYVYAALLAYFLGLLLTTFFFSRYIWLVKNVQMITLWNFAENKVVSVQPHDGYVADLAGCHATGMLASASHDGCVKVWR